MALSDAKIRAAKPRAMILKLSDGKGLQLWITPAKGKHWKLAYRYGQPQKQKVLPLGVFPAVGLAEARRATEVARALRARGVDPIEQRKADKVTKARADVWTFDTIAAELVDKKIREGNPSEQLKGSMAV
jgi:Arm DNA-binding domain